MKLLAADASSCQTEPTFRLVSTWLAQYGNELKAIVLPDVGPTVSGALRAIRQAKRKDIVLTVAGHSKISLDALKSGEMFYLLEQSGEGDGACTMQIAMDWMNGKELRGWYAIRHSLITKENADSYNPPQF